MLTKNQIIEQLYLSKGFTDCLNKMEPDHLREDLRQDVTVILLATEDEKIKNLHDNGQLTYYAVRIIINQIQSTTSPFAKLYRQMVTPYPAEQEDQIRGRLDEFYPLPSTDETDLQERAQREEWEDKVMELTYAEIDKLYWYDKEMILAYQKYGSFREIEKHTRIPFNSCYHTVKKAMKIIKRNVINPLP